MSQLDLYRFIDTMDIEDVALKNRGDYNVVDSGEWLTPGEFALGIPTWQRNNFVSSSDKTTRLSRMVWMEKGRTDSRAVGKVSVIMGDGTRARTDVFKAGTYAEGDELTLVKEEDSTSENYNKIVLAPKSGDSDIVKAICLVAPNHDPDGLLHFELK